MSSLRYEVLVNDGVQRHRDMRLPVAGHKNRDLPDDPAILGQTRDYPGGRAATTRTGAETTAVLQPDVGPLSEPVEPRSPLVQRARPAVVTLGRKADR
jgi:hypothetical protein